MMLPEHLSTAHANMCPWCPCLVPQPAARHAAEQGAHVVLAVEVDIVKRHGHAFLLTRFASTPSSSFAIDTTASFSMRMTNS